MKIRHNKKSLMVLIIVAVVAVAAASIPNQSWGAPPLRDRDGDGFLSDIDCDDSNPAINPAATEVCGDGADNNCDGAVDEGCGGGVTDSDGDGFSDAIEQAVFALPSGLTMAVSGADSLPPCGVSPTPAERALCMDYLSPDLFVIVDRNSRNSYMPLPPYVSPPYSLGARFDPLATIPSLPNSLGLPIVAHELLGTSSDRVIAEEQRAVRVNEQDDTDLGALGDSSTGGNPNTPISGYGEVDVFTERIMNEVDRLCAQAYICEGPKNNPTCSWQAVHYCENEDGSVSINILGGQDPEPLGYYYIQDVLAHEVGHAIGLAPSDSPEVTLWHFNPNTGWVLEQSIGAKGVKDRDGIVTVTLYISEEYHPDSKAGYELK